MSLRDRLNRINGSPAHSNELVAIKESMARAARLAAENRRRLKQLDEALDDVLLPPAQSQQPPSRALPAYPQYVVVQAKAIAGPDRST